MNVGNHNIMFDISFDLVQWSGSPTSEVLVRFVSVCNMNCFLVDTISMYAVSSPVPPVHMAAALFTKLLGWNQSRLKLLLPHVVGVGVGPGTKEKANPRHVLGSFLSHSFAAQHACGAHLYGLISPNFSLLN